MVTILCLLIVAVELFGYFYVERRLILRNRSYALAAKVYSVKFAALILILLILGYFDRFGDHLATKVMAALFLSCAIRFAIKYRS